MLLLRLLKNLTFCLLSVVANIAGERPCKIKYGLMKILNCNLFYVVTKYYGFSAFTNLTLRCKMCDKTGLVVEAMQCLYEIVRSTLTLSIFPFAQPQPQNRFYWFFCYDVHCILGYSRIKNKFESPNSDAVWMESHFVRSI